MSEEPTFEEKMVVESIINTDFTDLARWYLVCLKTVASNMEIDILEAHKQCLANIDEIENEAREGE